MTSEKDREAIQKNKLQIQEQVENTKKLDLGLDADKSSRHHHKPKSMFDGFIYDSHIPPLDDK